MSFLYFHLYLFIFPVEIINNKLALVYVGAWRW